MSKEYYIIHNNIELKEFKKCKEIYIAIKKDFYKRKGNDNKIKAETFLSYLGDNKYSPLIKVENKNTKEILIMYNVIIFNNDLDLKRINDYNIIFKESNNNHWNYEIDMVLKRKTLGNEIINNI